MARIASVQARTVVVPLDKPVSFSTRQVEARHYTLVRVQDRDGDEGIGFCYSGNAAGELTTMSIRQLIAPATIAHDSYQVREIWENIYAETLLHGRAGLVMRALSATDIALWDLGARKAGVPLWRYLGASEASVPAYASGGYYQDDKEPGDLAQEMKGYVAQGFKAVKMKVGRVPPPEDADRISAVRREVGPGVTIMLDANNAWRELGDALVALRLWEVYQPYWIEEPFGPDDIANHARLAKETPILVATGEIEAGRWRHQQLLEAGAVQVLQTDAAVCGGITEFQTIAATAASYGVPMAPHWFHELHIHLVASTPNAQYVEYFPDDSIANFRRLITRQPELIADGRLRLPHHPGLGFDFDLEAVDRYASGPWS